VCDGLTSGIADRLLCCCEELLCPSAFIDSSSKTDMPNFVAIGVGAAVAFVMEIWRRKLNSPTRPLVTCCIDAVFALPYALRLGPWGKRNDIRQATKDAYKRLGLKQPPGTDTVTCLVATPAMISYVITLDVMQLCIVLQLALTPTKSRSLSATRQPAASVCSAPRPSTRPSATSSLRRRSPSAC
jgi:hypothetical protein